MTAENYKKHLENLKSQGKSEPRPKKDEERQAVYDQVFVPQVKKESKEEKSKK